MAEESPTGATSLDPDDREGLLLPHVRTRKQLDLWEQENILRAALWIRSARMPALDERTIRTLHRRMFDQVWAWAGTYRTSDKNIGVPWFTLPERVADLVEDGRYWLDQGTHSVHETVLRLHHRLVAIHPFPNGNGRHARLWCDLLMRQLDHTPIEWKSRELDRRSEARAAYIQALEAADRGDYEPLFDLYPPKSG